MRQRRRNKIGNLRPPVKPFLFGNLISRAGLVVSLLSLIAGYTPVIWLGLGGCSSHPLSPSENEGILRLSRKVVKHYGTSSLSRLQPPVLDQRRSLPRLWQLLSGFAAHEDSSSRAHRLGHDDRQRRNSSLGGCRGRNGLSSISPARFLYVEPSHQPLTQFIFETVLRCACALGAEVCLRKEMYG